MPDDAVTVVVLTGGRSRRMGQDKAGVRLGDRSMLDRVLDAVPAGMPCVIAGPHDPDRPGVVVVREDRPFGGPAAGLAAALPHVGTPIVVVSAVDMPRALPAVLPLVEVLADPAVDAAVPVDGSGRRQVLAAAYRTAALRTALAGHGEAFGTSLREVLAGLRVFEVPGLDDAVLADVDTPADAASVQALLRGDGPLA